MALKSYRGQIARHEDAHARVQAADPAVLDGLGLTAASLRDLMLAFHGKLQPFRNGLSIADIITLLYLDDSADKAIRHYSSGMRQRVKLGLALLTDTPIVLLDEPCANLDSTAIAWYNGLVADNQAGRILIVCSNAQEHEYSFCKDRLLVSDFV